MITLLAPCAHCGAQATMLRQEIARQERRRARMVPVDMTVIERCRSNIKGCERCA